MAIITPRWQHSISVESTKAWESIILSLCIKNDVESQIVPLFSQSLTIRVVGSVLNDARRRCEKIIVLEQYRFQNSVQVQVVQVVLFQNLQSKFTGELGRSHNGGYHANHVTRWWRHGKQRWIDGRSFHCRWRSGREVSDRVWINSGPRRLFPVEMQLLDTQLARLDHNLVCKVSLVVRSWLLTPRHAKLCELVGKGRWSFWQGSEFAALNLDWGDIFWTEVNFTMPGLVHVLH